MGNAETPECRPDHSEVIVDASASAARWMSELAGLLTSLEYATEGATKAPSIIDSETDNLLVQRRLGIAASLFVALKCRHASVAAHGVRVGLTCSEFGRKKRLSGKDHDRLEVAALLHDVGVIGVPDRILLKAGKLDRDEARVMAGARRMSCDILRASCVDDKLIDIVANIGVWYDGSNAGGELARSDIPLGARAISIVEAFDSMTTDHVFRRAMSKEHALAELFRCAGTQFDPDLVEQFAELVQLEPSQIHRHASRRWLQQLDPSVANAFWQGKRLPALSREIDPEAAIMAQVIENMRDGVVFVDKALRVTGWNPSAEQLTGISSTSIFQKLWTPQLLTMRDDEGRFLDDDDCPLQAAVTSSAPSLQRCTISVPADKHLPVETHAIPLLEESGSTLGAALLIRNTSREKSLEQQCEKLQTKTTLDPLTQISNRAEYERVHAVNVERYHERNVPCCLIICDLDHFKQVNDRYGHQAGDDVIVGMASLLRRSARPGDLVARYGGEEFVMLCADCDISSASRRAEKIRREFARIQHPRLSGRNATASFGVTQTQPGDTPATMLRRADRALFMAKHQGRNRVVQLGGAQAGRQPTRSWAFWRRGRKPAEEAILQEQLVTTVPLRVVFEKLRGFVADHEASVAKPEEDTLELRIEQRGRRMGDRRTGFLISIRFEEEQVVSGDPPDPPAEGRARIRLHVKILPEGAGDRRRRATSDQARQVMHSLQAYLMASPAVTRKSHEAKKVELPSPFNELGP